MANIRVDVPFSIMDGSEVVFSAPRASNEIDGMKVYYPKGSQVFLFKDAHGNILTGLGNLFSAGALVKAILDVTNSFAYIQNADTNKYLESKFESIQAGSAEHTQPASSITEGTFAGKVNANVAAAESVAVAQVRDISAGTEDMVAGSSPLTTGTLYFVFE